MRKIVLFAVMLGTAFPCAAQKNPFKWWKNLRTAARPAVSAPSFRVVQGKILPSPGRAVVPVRQLELEKYVARAVRLTPLEKISFATTPASLHQREHFLRSYQETMQRFNAFKREMDPFLYYRLKEGYGKEVSPEESRRLLPAITNMERELLLVKVAIDAKEDEALSFALEYVARVRDELIPIVKGMSGEDLYFSRQDRTFVGDEFYLHAPELKRWTSMLRFGRARALAGELPRGLRVAVLNDRLSVLERMTRFHREGVFIQDGELACFEQADDLIASVRSGQKYDLILTDIIVNGGGGYYLTNILRLEGFSGTIIALSAFERDDAMGMEMFKRGFDGMLNLPIGFEFSPFWAADVMDGLNNYFKLRRKHKWQR